MSIRNKIEKLFLWAGIFLRADILNPLWRDRKRRRAARLNAYGDAMTKYSRKFLPAAAALPACAAETNPFEKIYSMWLQGEDSAPQLVKSCFSSVRRHCSQELLVLDEKSLANHIDLPGFIMDKRARGQIGHAHFADIARVELLHNHGGFWTDASNFITQPIPQNIVDQDFFVYLANGEKGAIYSFMQNCFIRGKKNAYLLEAWRAMIHEYWKNEPKRLDYFIHQLLFKTLVTGDPRAKVAFAEMPHVCQDPTHILWSEEFRDKPFDQKEFDKVAAGAFFHKLGRRSYKKTATGAPEPGTFADVITKM
ncbi:MAG: capsular polysaccharide synthesis protein [Rickettsiales bacterium]|jgi:hypothetical protein|nr:capsular polysaccharide synthesis protein [Rickettsiales bacterium]